MHQKLFLKILGYFLQDGKDYRFQSLGHGLINDTYHVSGNGQDEYILQRLNTSVFRNTTALMGNMEHALSLLKATDYSHITLVKTLDGSLFAGAGASGCWRLLTYLNGSTTYNTTGSSHIAFEAGRVISRFHSLLKTAPLEAFEDTLPGFHDLQLRSAQLQTALKTASADRLRKAEKAIRIASELLEYDLPYQLKDLPLRVCHNDTKLNNILFDKATGNAMCLIDLDTVMKGYLMYDFGDAVRTIANTAAEDEPAPEKIRFSKPLFESFVDGFWSAGLKMEAIEVASLPYGVIYMPLLHGIRALTDYLSGDIYYKVSFPEQNLDRSVSLLTYAQRAEGQLGYMRRQISAKGRT